jgi:acylphosphatase
VKRVRVLVSGRVQGVAYRYACESVAAGHGLAGWVRNRPDGRVEAVFEGLDADVDAALAWCGQGPPAAFVESLEVSAEPPTGERGFRIR